MHGLIFVTWEKYLAERFGSSLRKRPQNSARIARHNNNSLISCCPSCLLEMASPWGDLQSILHKWQVSPHQQRPSVLLEALRHLQHAGLVASTANQSGDDLTHRRYWRAPTSGK